MKYYLAIDMGASSGRHIVGWQENGNVMMEEVHRFSNYPDTAEGHLVWDIDRLFKEVKAGIAAAFRKYPKIESIAVDTWGADYVLLDGSGKEILPCYCYRDSRTEQPIKSVHEKIPFEQLYSLTGIQYLTFNTVYQLYDDLMRGRLAGAAAFLMMPAYFNYKLTGVMKQEYTQATTGALVTAGETDFSGEVINRLGLPKGLFGPLHMPGEAVGQLLPEIAEEVGGSATVTLCASHDTASAFESIDADYDSLILSSGTWSLLGAKIKKANLSKEGMHANFTNEGGLGYIRYLKNITGLWVLNHVREEFSLSFKEAVDMAKASGYHEIFDINAPDFVAPPKMTGAIVNWFEREGKKAPASPKDVVSSVYRSLAASYKKTVDEIESVLKKEYSKLYIIGGGAKDEYLNTLAAKYTQKEVIALPIEATAVGNLEVQMRAGRPK